MAEWFELVDMSGRPVGCATRAACHRNTALLHRVVHVIVVNHAGEIYLQKRAQSKDIQPGKWDTSVGGHVCPGEHALAAARREMREELGIAGAPLMPLHEYIWRSDVESEYVTTFLCRHDGPFALNKDEIDEGRWWPFLEIWGRLGSGAFTPNCVEELRRYTSDAAATA